MRMKSGWRCGLWLAWCVWSGAVMAQTTPPSASVSLVVVGDIMFEGGPDRAMRARRDPFLDFAGLFKSADVRVGNLECVVSTVGTAEPDKPNTFRVHPQRLKYIARHFDAVGLANNHSGDFGPKAFADMLGALKRHGIGYYGGGMNLQEAHTPLIIERKGVRIALLGYDEFQPRSFEADHDRPGVAWSEDEQVVRDIRLARTQWHADVVIPIMHWGWEEPVANARQRKLARLMVDAGADLVIGGHPHQVQDTEQYKGKPIFYSLGNFVFDGFPDAVNNIGWAIRFELDKQGVRSWQVHTAKIDHQGLPHSAAQVQRVNLR
ncbi:poly-gamma-glutamate biosynthesis protein [Limnohabitans sp. JirII-29]|uniref:CapA family protein n=1 Tax=Limnohabitans sp. JirII-29 TaxID=1835756 RepID=UPI000D3BF2E5|nr:CapA family protein [Limnohabitans sp. JirII-29]PUE30408.1 poly-gamma-glutamate biosynthesis protein [Limnohabitans sp. JirII-29]